MKTGLLSYDAIRTPKRQRSMIGWLVRTADGLGIVKDIVPPPGQSDTGRFQVKVRLQVGKIRWYSAADVFTL